MAKFNRVDHKCGLHHVGHQGRDHRHGLYVVIAVDLKSQLKGVGAWAMARTSLTMTSWSNSGAGRTGPMRRHIFHVIPTYFKRR